MFAYNQVLRIVKETKQVRKFNAQCFHCGKQKGSGNMYRCSCKAAQYCSKACQLADWENHKICHDTCVGQKFKTTRSILNQFNATIPSYFASCGFDEETFRKLHSKGAIFRATRLKNKFHIHPLSMKEWVQITKFMHPGEFKRALKGDFNDLKQGHVLFALFSSQTKCHALVNFKFL